MRQAAPRLLLRSFVFSAICLLATPKHADAADDGVRVSCLETDWTFSAGELVTRTLKIVNHTSTSEPFDLEWSFQIDGKAYGEGAETFALKAGAGEEYTLAFPVPPLPGRTAGTLVITCLRDGQEVFRDAKPCTILGPAPAPIKEHAAQQRIANQNDTFVPCCGAQPNNRPLLRAWRRFR